MPNEDYFFISSALLKMIDLCKSINQQLKQDLDLFNHRDLEFIKESNKKKMDAITQLATLINELKSRFANGLQETIYSQSNNNLQELNDQLHVEVMNCSKNIEKNTSQVSLNLQFLKEIWDSMIALNSEKNVYDKTGSVIS